MKIQVLISYRTVYGDAVILLNYYHLLSTRWWLVSTGKKSTVRFGRGIRGYQIQIRKTVPIWFMNIYIWIGINIRVSRAEFLTL